jgi:hypothetical protein
MINTLEHLTHLAATLLELQRQREQSARELADLDKSIERLGRHDIPDVMDELDIAEFTMKDGSKITVDDMVVSKPLAANRAEAWEWMKTAGFGDLVKHDVTVAFARGEDDAAKLLVEHAEGLGFMAKNTESVHHGTLNKFVREYLETGKHLPMDLFGVNLFKQAKVKRGK